MVNGVGTVALRHGGFGRGRRKLVSDDDSSCRRNQYQVMLSRRDMLDIYIQSNLENWRNIVVLQYDS